MIDKLDELLIYQYILKKDKLDIITNRLKPSLLERIRINRAVKKREKNVPLQYILGEMGFMGLKFFVNKNVLIPREDTETLVEAVLECCNPKENILEIGTGSGCIAVSLAKLASTNITAIDISSKVLRMAKQNAQLHDVNVKFIRANIFSKMNLGEFDILVSNPPYIPTRTIEELQPEVKEYEPFVALDGDEDGLKFYRRIAEIARKLLNKDGKIFLEIGQNQEEDIIEIFKNYKYLGYKKDLAGIIRVLKFAV